MLPEPLRLLVSAYATGELSPRRRKAAVRLLRHSREARHLLRELKLNRQRLRALPRPSLPPDFADRVLAALPPPAEPIIRPSQLTASAAARRPFPTAVAVAAAVLVAVSIGTGILISLPQDGPDAGRAIVTDSQADRPDVAAVQPAADEADEFVPPPPEITVPERAIAKDPPPGDSKPTDPPKKATPRRPQADPLGNVPLPPPELVKVAPPRLLTIPMRTLDDGPVRQKLQQELGKAESHHIDLFCTDSTHGLDRVRAALRARGIRLIVDGNAQESLKRKLQAQYLVYCDDLTVAQWTQVLRRLGTADKQAEEQKAGSGLFDCAVVLALDAADRREITTLFGSDLTRQVPSSGATGQEGRRPGTESVPPAGGPGGQSEPPKDGKVAMVASLGPWRAAPASKQVRQYLDARHGRTPGTVAVMLVVRTVNN